jgi:hypothetical protein
MYYTKCILEKCVSEFSHGGTGEFRDEWVPTHYAVAGNLLRLEDNVPWVVIKAGTSVTITKYIEKLGDDVLERFKHKPWYEALKHKHKYYVASN